MVKGISRQVIVVQSPDQKLFDQAIFILKDAALEKGGVTDEVLFKEVKRLMGNASPKEKRHLRFYGPVWALAGALITGAAWVLTMFL